MEYLKLNNETIKSAVKEWLLDETTAEAIYGHISNWDVSKVTQMNQLFYNKIYFNQPIGNWDVSNVTTMSHMFTGATSFNQDLSTWDVSKVTNMGAMFSQAKTFNQDLSTWDVSSVTDMHYMFFNATSFNQPIGNWVVNNANKNDLMFAGATSFNQDLSSWNLLEGTGILFKDLPQWVLPKPNYTREYSFKLGKSNWDTSNLTEKTFHENGNLFIETEVDESGQRNGTRKAYYDDGQLIFEMCWTNNIKDDGEVITYHPDGSKHKKFIVLNGELNGDFFEWYQNGNMKIQGTYLNGEFNGNFIEWYQNSNIKIQGTYVWGNLYIEKEFDENGVLLNFKSLKFNHEELELALKEWIDNPKTAEAKYGHISNWDTTEVKNIADIYIEAKSLNIDVTNWSLSFEENGLLFKQINQKNFTAYHKNGNKRFEYINIDLSEKYHWLDTVIDSNSNSKLLAYDENGLELKEFTVFLIPKRGNTLVVFKTDKSNLKGFEHFSDTEFLLSEISYRDAINLTGDDEIDLKKYPPIMLDGSHSQSLLDILKEWIPDKKFVMVYRWNRLHEDNCNYEDYLCQFEAGDISEHYSHKVDHTEEELAVLRHYDKIFITGKKSDSDEPGQEITKFPGSATRDFVGLHSPFDYDELRIFEEEVFNNLNVEIDNEMMDIEGQKFPIAKKLILDVDKYKKLKLSPSL